MSQATRFCFGHKKEGFVPVFPGCEFKEGNQFGFLMAKDPDDHPLAAVKFCNTGCYSSEAGVPLQFVLRVPERGFYRVTVTLQNDQADMTATIFSTHRRFQLTEKHVGKGEPFHFCFSVCFSDVQPNEGPLQKGGSILIGVMGKGAVLSGVEITKAEGITVFLAGDSTVTDQAASYPYHAKTSYCGWGQMLSEWLRPDAAVSNHAQSGLTTDTFRADNHWKVVLNQIGPGDFCLFQFGHNDQKYEELQAFGRYLDNLKDYIRQTREKGACPVVCSPINRILFEENGSMRDLLQEYADAASTAAEEEGVPFIDLHRLTTAVFTDMGPDKAPEYFWNDGKTVDRTHPNDHGGALIARLVAQEIKRQGILPLCDCIREEFIPYRVPRLTKKTVRRKGAGSGFLLNDSIKINTVSATDLEGCAQRTQILTLLAKGILTVKEDGRFCPEDVLLAKDAAAAMLRSLGCRGGTVKDARDKGLVPFAIHDEDPLSREQLCAMLVSTYNLRAPDKAIIGTVEHYRDRADISGWALNFVRAAEEMRFIDAADFAGMFNPGAAVTRGLAAKYIHKMMATR